MAADAVTVIGLVAGALTTLSLVPQVFKTWKTKSARDLSLRTFSILTVGIFLWLVYGLMIGDLPLIAANTVTFILALTIVWFKVRYG